MVDVKQVDIDLLADIREAMGQKIIADELRAGRSDVDNWPWKPLTVLATQREAYEARIAELERERDAAKETIDAIEQALMRGADAEAVGLICLFQEGALAANDALKKVGR